MLQKHFIRSNINFNEKKMYYVLEVVHILFKKFIHEINILHHNKKN